MCFITVPLAFLSCSIEGLNMEVLFLTLCNLTHFVVGYYVVTLDQHIKFP